MSINFHKDIGDDEIRIISPSGNEAPVSKRRKSLIFTVLAIGAILLIAIISLLFIVYEPDDKVEIVRTIPQVSVEKTVEPTAKAFTSVRDTTVNGVELLILNPNNATPTLEIGTEALDDSTVILATQAADVRSDNGSIAGAFIMDGNLMAKGEAKAGFCSIINGEIAVGVADATPMFEQAMTTGGYFFRQYPLVVGGQLIENKPNGKAIRKALAEIDGEISVIISAKRLTFHDFAQALIEAGVRNAIYLVGSTSSGVYVDEAGQRIPIGLPPVTDYENLNFIVWR